MYAYHCHLATSSLGRKTDIQAKRALSQGLCAICIARSLPAALQCAPGTMRPHQHRLGWNACHSSQAVAGGVEAVGLLRACKRMSVPETCTPATVCTHYKDNFKMQPGWSLYFPCDSGTCPCLRPLALMSHVPCTRKPVAVEPAARQMLVPCQPSASLGAARRG